MSNLFSKSIMVENTSLHSLVSKPVSETYLDSSVKIMEEMTESINTLRDTLYSGILEATSRNEENKKFAQYFKDYKQVICKYQRDMSELVSRFAINVDTFVDANSTIVDKADGLTISGDPLIKIRHYENLDNDKIPNINVYKAFKKEFKFIGQMMQDLGSAITDDEVKAKVLATVCNNLAENIQDGWLEKCMQKIADSDDCSKDNFANIIYSKFVSGELEEINIGVGEVEQARLALMNASALVDGVERASTEYSDGLDKVASEIGAMFFRNQDKIMTVKTEEDGIADRNYHLTDYSFNQFDQFMATKTTQITQICNLYLIALGIKCDSIYKYLQQCKDIIEAALSGVDSTPNSDINEPGENDTEENVDDNSNNDTDQSSDDEDEESEDNPDDMPEDTERVGRDMDNTTPDEEPKDDPNKEVIQDDEKADEAEKEFEEASYLFDSMIYAMDRAIQESYIQDKFMVLTEADNLEALKKAGENAQASKIQSFINQITKLFEKFKGVFINSTKTRIEKIQNNKKFIEGVDIPKGWTQDAWDTKALLEIKAADFKYPDPNLKDEATYLNANWSKYLGEGNSIKDRFTAKLQTKDKPYDNAQRQAGFAFLAKFESEINQLQSEMNTLKSNQTKAKSIAQKAIGESTQITSLEESMVMYFNEKDNMGSDNGGNDSANKSEPPKNNNSNNNAQQNKNDDQKNDQNKNDDQKNDNNDQKKKANTEAVKQVSLYFAVNVKVLAAKMSMLQMAAKSHCNFLEKLYSMSGKEDNGENK